MSEIQAPLLRTTCGHQKGVVKRSRDFYRPITPQREKETPECATTRPQSAKADAVFQAYTLVNRNFGRSPAPRLPRAAQTKPG